jgi:hypothetical protein
MTEISQSETSRSHIVHLLEQQKYNEALPMLSDLTEKNPPDRESYMVVGQSQNWTCRYHRVRGREFLISVKQNESNVTHSSPSGKKFRPLPSSRLDQLHRERRTLSLSRPVAHPLQLRADLWSDGEYLDATRNFLIIAIS